jgi:hypothetical protein
MFREWLFAVLKKWLWVLGLAPAIVDFVSVYIPSRFIPSPVASFLASGATLPLSLTLFVVGFFASTYLVYKDSQQRSMARVTEFENRLEAYEHHAPEYEIAVTDVEVGSCLSGCHVEVGFNLSLAPLNPWAGHLASIFIDNRHQITGLGEWTDLTMQKSNQSPVHPPTEINAPNLALYMSMKAEIGIEKQLIESEWSLLGVPITLVIGYFTQPVGNVEIKRELTLPVDLRKRFLAAQEYQRREQERIRDKQDHGAG